MVYQFKKRSSIKNVDPQLLGEELESFTELTPANLLNKAKAKTHLLHNSFLWDNDKAGEMYRKQQARNFINCVEIIVQDDTKEIKAQAFINIQKNEEEDEVRQYKLITLVLENRDETAEMLEQAKKELVSWRQRYSALKELARIFSTIDELELV